MKKFLAIITLASVFAISGSTARAFTYCYWDINGTDAGSGGPSPSGSWEGTNWYTATNTVAPGDDGTQPTGAFAEGSDAHFCAGTDATGAYTITATTNHTVGAFWLDTPGACTLTGSNLTFTSTGDAFGVVAGGTLTISNALSAAAGTVLNWSAANGNGTLNLAGNNTFAFNSSGNLANINLANTGTLILSGTNSFGGNHSLGAIYVTGAGTVVLANDNCLGGCGNASGNVWLNFQVAGATLQSQGVRTITGASSGIMVGLFKSTTITGDPLTLNGKVYFGLSALNHTINNVTTITGGVGPYGAGPHLYGTGELILSCSVAPTFSGPLFLDGATLGIGSANQIPVSLQIDAQVGGYVQAVNGARTIAKPLIFSAGGCGFAVIGNNPLTFSAGCTLAGIGDSCTMTNASTADATISGTISGGAAFNVYGPGRLVFSTPATGNTYAGGTTINSGTLKASGNTSGSATGSGGTAINGGFLTGTGIIASLTVNSGGTVQPGDAPNPGPGRLTTGDATLNGGGHYGWQINNATGTAGAASGWNLLAVQGSVYIESYPGNEFILDLTTLAAGNTAGTPASFDASHAWSWPILTATGSIYNFSPDAFIVNAAGFLSPYPGVFTVVQNGSEVDLVYTPPLLLGSPVVLGDRTMQLIIPSAVAGTNYTFWRATNLVPPVAWTPMFSTQALSSGSLQYIDRGATNAKAAFYRLSVP